MTSSEHFERLCEVFYTSSESQERKESERQLLAIQSSLQYLPQLLEILKSSRSNYALLVAATSINGLVGREWNKMSADERLELRVLLMQYLAARGDGTVADFVLNSVIRAVTRIVKLGWFDNSRHRDIVDESAKLYKSSASHCRIALRLLLQLVEEFNSTGNSFRGESRSLTQQRKAAVSFRDNALYPIVQMAQSTLQRLRTREGLGPLEPAQERGIAENTMKLLTACLGYDFIGTNADESADDVGTVQLPSAWRPVAHDPTLITTLFEFFANSEPPVSSSAMQSLIFLSSVRRSLFPSEQDRENLLNQLMRGIRDILSTQRGLQHEANYHEFCRMLGRLKSNYQLSELVGTEGYCEWLDLAKNFTLSSFDQWHFSRNSIMYLLTLWGRLVAAAPYAQRAAPAPPPGDQSNDDPSPQSPAQQANSAEGHVRLLEACVIEVAKKYIEAMLVSVHMIDASDGALDDPLDDEDALKEQLERLPVLCRFRYAAVAQFLLEGLDATLAQFRSVLESGHQARGAVERRLAWLTYVVAAVVGGVNWNQMPTTEGEERLDADLSRRCFEIARLVDIAHQGLSRCDSRLELALLYFLTQFRRVYLWETTASSSHSSGGDFALAQPSSSIGKQKLFARVFETLALGDVNDVTNRLVAKIANNLRFWPDQDEIITATLALFQEMAAGLTPSKLLLNLEATQFLLEHRTKPEALPFVTRARPRHRTTLHATLTKLVLGVSEDAHATFDAFMAPIQQTLVSLREALALSQLNGNASTGNHHQQQQAKVSAVIDNSPEGVMLLVGCLRDLRGVIQAANNRRTYNMMFDLLYPEAFDVLAAAALSERHEVLVALMRCVQELVHNKSQRITFERSSPNGILLFRECSRIIVAMGSRRLAGSEQYYVTSMDDDDLFPGDDDLMTGLNATDSSSTSRDNAVGADSNQEYKIRHKLVVISLNAVQRALDGNYVNFGVFELYNDAALSDALEVAIRLSFTASIADIMAFPKLTGAYFSFYEIVFREHAPFVLTKDTATLLTILGAVRRGLEQPYIAAPSAAIIDHLATFRFTNQHRAKIGRVHPAAQALDAHLIAHPTLFNKLLAAVLNLLIFGPPANHWTLTRPVLPLMLVDEKGFLDYRDALLASQPTPEIQQRLSQAFNNLVSHVHRNLDNTNRDFFSQQISAFRHECRSFLVC